MSTTGNFFSEQVEGGCNKKCLDEFERCESIVEIVLNLGYHLKVVEMFESICTVRFMNRKDALPNVSFCQMGINFSSPFSLCRVNEGMVYSSTW